MTPYWLLFSAVSLLAVLLKRDAHSKNGLWIFVTLLLAAMVGLRHEVGCDWFRYVWYYDSAQDVVFTSLLKLSDPGYQAFNWLAAYFDWGIYGTNFLSALVFTWGLAVFCRAQPNPWLALAVAIPYLVVVVSMGYTRQAVALGFVFASLVMLEQRNLKRFLIYVTLATLFHKTAVIMIPFGLFLFGHGWLVRAFAVLMVGVALWATFLAEYQDELWNNYVLANMQSQGATIRILMNLTPAVLLLVFWRRWKTLFPQSRIWFWMALAAIACLPLLSVASTATDRIALYITPLQIVVLSRLPELAGRQFSPHGVTSMILVGYGVVLFVWLNFAVHSRCWVPYNNLWFL